MTYYIAGKRGEEIKHLIVHPLLAENHIVVYASPEQAKSVFGGDCDVYTFEYDENFVADGKCFGRPGEYWLFSSVDVQKVG